MKLETLPGSFLTTVLSYKVQKLDRVATTDYPERWIVITDGLADFEQARQALLVLEAPGIYRIVEYSAIEVARYEYE